MFPALFLLFSFLEIYSLIWLGGQVGGMWAFGWVLFSAAIGIFAIRTQHEFTVNAMVRELNRGGVPQLSLVDAIMVFVGGIMLVLPGLFSDFLGVLLLVPFTRLLFRKEASRFMQHQAARAQAGNGRAFFFTMNSKTFGNGPIQHSGPSSPDEFSGQSFGPGAAMGGFASGSFPSGDSPLPPRQTEAVIIDTEVVPPAVTATERVAKAAPSGSNASADTAGPSASGASPSGGSGNNSGSL